MGRRSQPWSLAYFSNAATPASSTSMPTFTGTLPVVNQRRTQRETVSPRSGRGGNGGGGGLRTCVACHGVGTSTEPSATGGGVTEATAGGGGSEDGEGTGADASGGGGTLGAGDASAGCDDGDDRGTAPSLCASATCMDSLDTWDSRSPTRRFRPLMETSATINITGIDSTSNASKSRPSIPDIPVVRATLTGADGITHPNEEAPPGRGFHDHDAAGAYFAATTLTISRHLLL